MVIQGRWSSNFDAGSDRDVDFPKMRLTDHDDPEAYNSSTQQYGAHKLPKDVADAARVGGDQLRELHSQWRELIQRMDNTSLQVQADDYMVPGASLKKPYCAQALSHSLDE